LPRAIISIRQIGAQENGAEVCLFGFSMTPLIIQRPPEPDERLNPPWLKLQGGDKGVHFVPGTDGHGLRTNRVGADEPVGAVLFRRADGNENAGRTPDIGFGLAPSAIV
jgi:hypothetical protein